MSPNVSLEGDDVRVPTRMILAPEAGTFRPSPPEVCTTEGEVVERGSSVGTVESLGRTIDIRSAFQGFLMGMMALPGERVRAGQPVAWLHAIGGESLSLAAAEPVPSAAEPVPSMPVVPTTALPLAFAGWGAALPARVVTNDELALTLDTSDAWVWERTGIRARHVAGSGETTASLAAEAGRRALASAGVAATDVDLVVVATTTPDRSCPSTAADVAALLGTRAAACDVNAACAGFAYALHLAAPAVTTGLSPVTLLIGAERMSSVIDPTDRTTAVLFGDGAGAVVLAQRPREASGDAGAGVVASALDGDAALIPALEIPPGDAYLRMDGPAVFRAATRALVSSGNRVLERAGVAAGDVAWYVPHQANRRIIDAAVDRMGLAPDHVVFTLDRHGNTSAASIPLALAEAADDGRLRPGDLVLTSAMGAGMSWGSVLLRWGTT